jgi:chemotaxis protein MotB
MAYYMLTRGGVPAARFTRVEGYADRAPRDPAHPFAAVNRRLEILIEEPRP